MKVLNHVMHGCPTMDFEQACTVLQHAQAAQLLEFRPNPTFGYPYPLPGQRQEEYVYPLIMNEEHGDDADAVGVSKQLQQRWLPPGGSWTRGLDLACKVPPEEWYELGPAQWPLHVVEKKADENKKREENHLQEQDLKLQQLAELAEELDTDKLFTASGPYLSKRLINDRASCTFPCECDKCNPPVVIWLGEFDDEKEAQEEQKETQGDTQEEQLWAASIPARVMEMDLLPLPRAKFLWKQVCEVRPHQFGNDDCTCFFCVTGVALPPHLERGERQVRERAETTRWLEAWNAAIDEQQQSEQAYLEPEIAPYNDRCGERVQSPVLPETTTWPEYVHWLHNLSIRPEPDLKSQHVPLYSNHPKDKISREWLTSKSTTAEERQQHRQQGLEAVRADRADQERCRKRAEEQERVRRQQTEERDAEFWRKRKEWLERSRQDGVPGAEFMI
jgi:hypothetical protein